MFFIYNFYSTQTFLQLQLWAQMLNILSESMFFWEENDFQCYLLAEMTLQTREDAEGEQAFVCRATQNFWMHSYEKLGSVFLWVMSHQRQTIPSQLQLPQHHCNWIQGVMEKSHQIPIIPPLSLRSVPLCRNWFLGFQGQVTGVKLALNWKEKFNLIVFKNF